MSEDYQPTGLHMRLLAAWKERVALCVVTPYVANLSVRCIPGEPTARLIEHCQSALGATEADLFQAIEQGLPMGGRHKGLTALLIEHCFVEPVPAECGWGMAEWSVLPSVFSKRWTCPEDDIQVCNERSHAVRNQTYRDWASAGPCPIVAKREAQAKASATGAQTFDSFIQAKDRGAYAAAIGFLDGGQRCIVLRGHTGTGKTHLGRAILGAAAKSGKTTAIWTHADFCDRARLTRAYGELKRDAENDITAYGCSDVVLLDDLGRGDESQPESCATELQRLIDTNTCRIVVTTNHTEAQLRARLGVGDAVVSRLWSGVVVEMRGTDFRRRGH